MLSDGDVRYIRANFVPLAVLCGERGTDLAAVKALIEQRRLPRPSYSLDDGTEMVPRDYFLLYDAAGGEDVERLFRDRWAAQAKQLGVEWEPSQLADEWEGYLSGEYGVCLCEVTPENICAKGFHMDVIETLLARPRPSDHEWVQALVRNVNELDLLERPFAEFDRVRWGPVSRDRLITSVRERFPEAFSSVS